MVSTPLSPAGIRLSTYSDSPNPSMRYYTSANSSLVCDPNSRLRKGRWWGWRLRGRRTLPIHMAYRRKCNNGDSAIQTWNPPSQRPDWGWWGLQYQFTFPSVSLREPALLWLCRCHNTRGWCNDTETQSDCSMLNQQHMEGQESWGGQKGHLILTPRKVWCPTYWWYPNEIQRAFVSFLNFRCLWTFILEMSRFWNVRYSVLL